MQADLLKKNASKLDFSVDFYTDVLNLDYLLELLDDGPFTKRFKKLNAALVGLVEDYSLVSFIPLDVNCDKSLLELKNAIDKVYYWLLHRHMLYIIIMFHFIGKWVCVWQWRGTKYTNVVVMCRWSSNRNRKI